MVLRKELTVSAEGETATLGSTETMQDETFKVWETSIAALGMLGL